MMLKNYFKVVEDFDSSGCGDKSSKDSVDGELLSVEKGEIIVDVKSCTDDDWVMGKALVSQRMGKIPRKCIELLQDNDDDESIERKSPISDVKRCSRGSSDGKRSSSELDGKETVKEDSADGEPSKTAVRPPRAPPRVRKSREVTGQNVTGQNVTGQNITGQNVTGQNVAGQNITGQNDSFRSRGSDEGYNSSSHYSGEKPTASEPIVNKGYCNTRISDVPLLSSFRESPRKFTSPRPSITDAEGYEIPIFSPRSSVNGEIATGDEKGVTLKFIFNRKSTAFDEKSPEKLALDSREKASLNSIGENSESIYETWSTDPKTTNSSDLSKKRMREKILVGLFIATSLLCSLGFFFLLLFVLRVTALLCFTVSVNVFAIFFIGLLTMENKRWLCIASLLAPSLFSRQVKIAICITLSILIIAVPICNFSSNIDVVLRCKHAAARKVTATNESINAEIYASRQPAKATMPLPSSIINASQISVTNGNASKAVDVKNNTSAVLKKCMQNMGSIRTRCLLRSEILQQSCIKAMQTAVTNSVGSTCNSEDSPCVALMLEPRIQNICRNLSLEQVGGKSKPLKETKRPTVQEKESFKTFANTLLQLLPLLLLLLLQAAYQYNRDYLSNKEMDNVYITGKLKALDCERKERGMRNKLFPLRKLEFRKYVLPSFFLQTSQETREVLSWLIIWLVLGLSVLLVVLLDKYIYNALVFLYEDTKPYSSCHLTLKEIDVNIIYSLCFVLALLLIAVIIQSYILRSRSRICSFFYPKKESVRGVYLYHKILHDRSHFWKACRERGNTLSEARRTRWKIGIGRRLFRALPSSVRGAIQKLFVYRCMICDSLTCRKSFVCPDQECFATFCYECYIDMGQTCISCRPNGMRDSVFTSV